MQCNSQFNLMFGNNLGVVIVVIVYIKLSLLILVSNVPYITFSQEIHLLEIIRGGKRAREGEGG